MNLQSLTGITVLGVLAIVVHLLCGLAKEFFAGTPVRVRLAVFGGLVLVFAVPVAAVAMYKEVLSAPVPPEGAAGGASVSSATPLAASAARPLPAGSRPLSKWTLPFISQAHAQQAHLWLYCGTASAEDGPLLDAPFAASGDTIGSLRGASRRLARAASAYESEPSFSLASLRWTLPPVSTRLAAGTAVRIVEVKSLGQRRAWCRVHPA